MSIGNISIEETIKKVEDFLEKEKDLTPSTKAMFELLLMIITLLVGRLSVNSRNSSKPPSMDPNRKRIKKTKGEKQPGGQRGHEGATLEKVDDPDEIIPIKIDRRSIPHGDYKEAGIETRQVIDMRISRHVIEYQAEVLVNDNGDKYVAKFPGGVTRPVQYGEKLKSHAVYMSQYQLIPYNRVEEHFQNQIGMKVSAGSIHNFIKEAYNLSEKFELFVRNRLLESSVLNADETGINKNGENYWLHSLSNSSWTYFYPHKKRGSEAMDEIGLLPYYDGILCHDHWKPYFKYGCTHVLCNAHHLRELEGALERDDHSWAREMKDLLIHIKNNVERAGGALPHSQRKKYEKKYREILKKGEEECPPAKKKAGCRGRPIKTKSRNLLERLRDYMDATLRFMEDPEIPFTNNQGENDIRMTKVHQKISGCFRSAEGAKMFCRIRSYLSTCKKQGVGPSEALNLLFQGIEPDFMICAE